MPEDLNAVLKE